MVGSRFLPSVLLVVALSAITALAQMEAADVAPYDPALAKRENEYWEVVDVPIPWTINLEAGSFVALPEGRLAVGTRRGEVWIVDGARSPAAPKPTFRLFATGMTEVLGLALRDGVLHATQQGEVTRLIDRNGDGRADRYETVSDGWGWGKEHEYTYGSTFDKDGYLWVAHCLTGSYTSEFLFRGWAQRIAPDGTTIPSCSGLRSPGGVGINAEGDAFYTENQGPWNGACGLKHLEPGKFMGHPISFPWYEQAPNMGPAPERPRKGRDVRLHEEVARIPELQPTAVVFPYKKMGQSASGIVLDATKGAFGPFAGQLFVGDYTLSLVMRVDLERVGGVYQGACFPFRCGLKTGVIGVLLTEDGYLFTGGSNRGWPSRGREAYALERMRFTGKMPFEVRTMRVRPDGFALELTAPADPKTAGDVASYAMTTYTHRYHRVYGSPEVDPTTPTIREAIPSEDGLRVRLVVDGLQIGHVHELHLKGLRSRDSAPLLHDVAYYTLNVRP